MKHKRLISILLGLAILSAFLVIGLFLFSEFPAESERSKVAAQLSLKSQASWAQIQAEIYCKIAIINIYRGDLESRLAELGESRDFVRYGNSPDFIYTYPNSVLGKYVTLFATFDSENRLLSRQIIENFAGSSDYSGPEINCDQ